MSHFYLQSHSDACCSCVVAKHDLIVHPLLFPGKVLRHQILPEQYEDAVGDKLINLAVVLQDMSTLERILTSEEFNIVSPDLIIQVLIEDPQLSVLLCFIERNLFACSPGVQLFKDVLSI